ncbi:HlyD family type I secretion periplasmic adaptor subunit [Limnohabitans sp.]|jgi:protease secretion system membrane fusion protein|uniref:HlyD family type I secretion periplasmic adaptor subunit n=1 Tax=Limnohabitans sp. TaxID=1907725 RepID=UPI0037C04BCD
MNHFDEPAQEADDVTDKKRKYRDSGGTIRLGVWSLLLGLGGFVLWAMVAPLDEGVPSSATVAIETKRKAVQHPSGGVLKEVFVKEGQLVKEGELLMRISDSNAVAMYESSRHQYLSMRSVQARLLAEKTGQKTLQFHPDLLAADSDPLVANHMRNQLDLFASRQSALSAEMQAFEQSVQGLKAQRKGATELWTQRGVQLQLIGDELNRSRELIEQGYLTRQRGWDLERQIADLTGSRSDAAANIERLGSAIAEIQQRMKQRQQEFAKEVETQLTEVMRSVDAEQKRLTAVRLDLMRTEIRSPNEGQVVGLMTQSVGSVILAGQKIMDIVPQDERLILEAKIQPHLIDKVRAEEAVDIRFSSFSHSPQLVIGGRVESISNDLLTDQPPSLTPTYYLARVEVTPEGMRQLGNRQMQAGMPAEVIIRTGERSLMKYLLHPLIKRMAASMKEE